VADAPTKQDKPSLKVHTENIVSDPVSDLYTVYFRFQNEGYVAFALLLALLCFVVVEYLNHHKTRM